MSRDRTAFFPGEGLLLKGRAATLYVSTAPVPDLQDALAAAVDDPDAFRLVAQAIVAHSFECPPLAAVLDTGWERRLFVFGDIEVTVSGQPLAAGSVSTWTEHPLSTSDEVVAGDCGPTSPYWIAAGAAPASGIVVGAPVLSGDTDLHIAGPSTPLPVAVATEPEIDEPAATRNDEPMPATDEAADREVPAGELPVFPPPRNDEPLPDPNAIDLPAWPTDSPAPPIMPRTVPRPAETEPPDPNDITRDLPVRKSEPEPEDAGPDSARPTHCASCGVAIAEDWAFCRNCGARLAPEAAPAAADVAPQARLVLEDGRVLDLDRPLVLGRRPPDDHSTPNGPALPVVIDHQGISKTHALVGRVDGQVCVTDLGSTNGVKLLSPADTQPVKVLPLIPTVLDPGTRIILANGSFTLTYEA